ncbi:MAG: hypothetical protein QM747_04035 [Nocardioides sp.]
MRSAERDTTGVRPRTSAVPTECPVVELAASFAAVGVSESARLAAAPGRLDHAGDHGDAGGGGGESGQRDGVAQRLLGGPTPRAQVARAEPRVGLARSRRSTVPRGVLQGLLRLLRCRHRRIRG